MLVHNGTKTIETERLILRKFLIKDAEQIDLAQYAILKCDLIIKNEEV